MTLNSFMKIYTGNACISIAGYCEEEYYDYYCLPPKYIEDFSGNTPSGRIPSCLAREPWWNEIKSKKIESFSIIGGGMYKTELVINLEE